MTVLILFHSLDHLAGGVDNRVSAWELALPESIDREYLLYRDCVNLPHTGNINFIKQLNLPAFILRFKKRFRLLAVLSGFTIFLHRIRLTRKFIKSRPNLKRIVAFDDYFSAIALISSVGMNIKVICSVRNSWNRLYGNRALIHLLPDWFYKIVVAYLYRKLAETVHTVSEGLSDELRQDYSLPNVVTIYNIYDFSRIDELSSHQVTAGYHLDRKYLLAVGNLNLQKNHIDLLRSYRILRDKGINYPLLIIGDGSLRPYLESEAKKLNVGYSVIFLGKIANPYPYMKNAELLVSSSLYEGLSSVLIESIFLGTSLAVYDCPHGPSELTDSRTDMNPQALANLCWSLLADEEQAQLSIKRDRENLMEKFNPSVLMDKWLDIL